MSDLGEHTWATRTGGAIDDDDRDMLLHNTARYLEAAAGTSPREATLTIEATRPPDSELTREATTLWRDVAPAWLEPHGHRAWHFARGLAIVDQIDVDPELLFVACLLHDLGLTPAAPPTDSKPCFAVSGADAARKVVRPHRPGDASTVGDAIVMHLNIDVPLAAGPVHHLVAAGTMVDVAGAHLQRLPTNFVQGVLAAHPRGTFAADLGDCLTAVGERFPATRCGFMVSELDVAAIAANHLLDQ